MYIFIYDSDDMSTIEKCDIVKIIIVEKLRI